MEKEKLELRSYYQNQVEKVVQDKLKEFQAEVDRVEAAMRAECRDRELSVAKSAASHIQQITEK